MAKGSINTEPYLTKPTLDRLSREWNKRSGTGPFTIRAGTNPLTGENEINILEEEAFDPSNPYAQVLLDYGTKIIEPEMEDDLPKPITNRRRPRP